MPKGIPDNLSGQKFNFLIVEERTKYNDRSGYWKCKCDCGNIVIVRTDQLKNNIIRHCGCIKKDYSNSAPNFIGKKFNKLEVISLEQNYPKKGRHWKCICECGNITIASTGALNTNGKKSCGCLTKERYRKLYNIPLDEESYSIVISMRYKFEAKDRNLEWLLSYDEAASLFKSNCYYCDCPPSNKLKIKCHDVVYSGIDRLDNTKGYIKNNCVSCCKVCNFAKKTMSENDFYNWIHRVHNHLMKTNR